MATFGRCSTLSLIALLLAVAFTSVAMGTRGWLTGQYNNQSARIGLFTASLDDVVLDVNDCFPNWKDKFLTTLIIDAAAGGLLLLATASYLTFLMLTKKYDFLSTIYSVAATVSGLTQIVAVVSFHASFEDVPHSLDFSYCWFLTIFSGLITLAGQGSLFSAYSRNEFSKSFPDRTSTIQMSGIVNPAAKLPKEVV